MDTLLRVKVEEGLKHLLAASKGQADTCSLGRDPPGDAELSFNKAILLQPSTPDVHLQALHVLRVEESS